MRHTHKLISPLRLSLTHSRSFLLVGPRVDRLMCSHPVSPSRYPSSLVVSIPAAGQSPFLSPLTMAASSTLERAFCCSIVLSCRDIDSSSLVCSPSCLLILCVRHGLLVGVGGRRRRRSGSCSCRGRRRQAQNGRRDRSNAPKEQRRRGGGARPRTSRPCPRRRSGSGEGRRRCSRSSRRCRALNADLERRKRRAGRLRRSFFLLCGAYQCLRLLAGGGRATRSFVLPFPSLLRLFGVAGCSCCCSCCCRTVLGCSIASR